jgi:glycosyltransferase involved in cell wall biosynthesis
MLAIAGPPNIATSEHALDAASAIAPVAPGRLLMVEQGGRGGVADYTAQLTRALAAEGWHVQLASAADHLYAPAPGVSVEGVFHYVRGHTRPGRAVRSRGLGRIANGLRFLAALPRLARLARGADVVHTQGWELAPLGIFAVLALRFSGAPVVQTWHNTFERNTALARFDWMVRDVLARLTARTIVHTESDLAGLPVRIRDRAVVIPHGEYGALARTGGDVDRDAVRAELGLSRDAPVTLMFGQLRPDKGLGDLLVAVSAIPELHLIVAGQELGALAAERGLLESPELAGRVIVREGFLEMSEAARLFAATDTVSLPYEVASQSGVLLLAYGFGRPVVVYPVGGLVEAVHDGETGWICTSADSEALRAALADSVAAGWPECRRRGEAGARLALERFGWPAIAQRTGEVYRAARGRD